ncbi:hypothetical protein P692DRAFT_20755039 [Suillus brevipes Sb2]|nr:hypothetical protein P692DRAFT_20755039 [Suillus brevipes Sb2]
MSAHRGVHLNDKTYCGRLLNYLDNDECKPETVADLISLLGQALRDLDLPVIHTSRSEQHIRKAIQKEEMRTLVCEIPVNTSGDGDAATISLDGEDVDNDIYLFLQVCTVECTHTPPI